MSTELRSGVKYSTIDKTINVQVRGGSETTSMGASQISNTDFREAIKASIKSSELFSSVAEDSVPADYVLQGTIIRVEQPAMGFSMTVDLEIAWLLKESGEADALIREAHDSTYTASVGAAFAGVKRLRLATEGAAQNNILWVLDRISKLEL
tara:strand:- start:16883 stop:17338 length:456 start_codon:yes stop_codon:yes gene_type:complete